jgi:hypothetical protein
MRMGIWCACGQTVPVLTNKVDTFQVTCQSRSAQLQMYALVTGQSHLADRANLNAMKVDNDQFDNLRQKMMQAPSRAIEGLGDKE